LKVEVIESENAEQPAVRCIVWLDGWRGITDDKLTAVSPSANPIQSCGSLIAIAVEP
jgi:hypothetical protein